MNNNKFIILSPLAIVSFSTEEHNVSYPERKSFFRIKISSGVEQVQKNYNIDFDFSEEGFKLKEKTDFIISKLTDIMKHPLTCETVVKLTLKGEKDYRGNYIIEFI